MRERERDGWMVALLVEGEQDGWMVALLIEREKAGRTAGW